MKLSATSRRSRASIRMTKYSDGCPTPGCPADEDGTVPPEVPGPPVPARMEQRDNLPCQAVNSGYIWSFPFVASEAGGGQVGRDRLPAVLARDDVLDLKGGSVVDFRDVAIFAKPA